MDKSTYENVATPYKTKLDRIICYVFKILHKYYDFGLWKYLENLPYYLLGSASASYIFYNLFTFSDNADFPLVNKLSLAEWNNTEAIEKKRYHFSQSLINYDYSDKLLITLTNIVVCQGSSNLAKIILYELYSIGYKNVDTGVLFGDLVREMIVNVVY